MVIDHVRPVAKGGDNDPMNLITSCQDCNSGKSDRELDDNSVLSRQRAQVEELNERRLQIEMMLEWRNELLLIEKLKMEKLIEVIGSKSAKFSPNERGKETIARWAKQYDFDELLSAIDRAFEIYFMEDDEECWEKAFSKIPGIIKITRVSARKPYLPQLFYIRGILRNRLTYMRDADVVPMLERAVELGLDLDHFTELAKRFRSWTQFRDCIERFIAENTSADEEGE